MGNKRLEVYLPHLTVYCVPNLFVYTVLLPAGHSGSAPVPVLDEPDPVLDVGVLVGDVDDVDDADDVGEADDVGDANDVDDVEGVIGAEVLVEELGSAGFGKLAL